MIQLQRFIIILLILALSGLYFFQNHKSELYDYYTLKCWEIAIKKYKNKKAIARTYSMEYFKLQNVLDKCRRCQDKYYVK